jgi:hypothetical protein
VRLLTIGNYVPEYSTENDLVHALRVLGHDCMILQEDKQELWEKAIRQIGDNRYDAVLWTTTESLAAKVDPRVQRELQYTAALSDVTVWGYHLDRWWGLDRWRRVLVEPFFRSTVVCTADGHHDAQWTNAGIDHEWRLPGVSERWLGRANVRPEYECDIAFVGNWRDYGHTEWKHRPQLVRWLQDTYEGRVKFFPIVNQHAIRGRELNYVYASAKVVVGDSCLVPGVDGEPMTRYTSDRMPETLGRGGVLIHPDVDGVTSVRNGIDGLAPYVPGKHLLTWQLGNWDDLRDTIEHALATPTICDQIRDAAIEHVRQNHTYTVRMKSIFGEAS